MSSHPCQATAEIVERKGIYTVKIRNVDNTTIIARRDQNGRIRYDHPERVPRVMKKIVVPQKFKEIDEMRFGIASGAKG